MFGLWKHRPGTRLRQGLLASIAAGLILNVSAAQSEPPSPIVQDYANILVTYACYAKTLWHDANGGGYWGDGFQAKNQNGAVRGNCSTLLTYAMLVSAMDGDWIRREDAKVLRKAGLSRERMVDYIRMNLAYLVATHKSSPMQSHVQWGYNWQSSLWMQALGMATLLVYNDLGDELKSGVMRVAAAEAEWVGSHPPKDFANGDTGAEENAWNTGAPAVALALHGDVTSSSAWWKTLKSMTVNSYSHKSDSQTSASFAGLITTANLNPDWSMVNHRFFHPDYIQVTGMHLGEAWVILSLGDKLRGGNMARAFEEVSLHNVAEVWRRVMRPLLLPSGEFAFPAGNDWTFHCSTNQGYFAYMATALQDFDAALAEERAISHVRNRREVSPPGRLLGDSNLEWWWEPLVCKRICSAILMHQLRPGHPQPLPPPDLADNLTTTVHFADASAWIHRTPEYFFSVSYGKTRLGYFVPLGGAGRDGVHYTTLPVKNGLLPEGEWEFRPARANDAGITGGTFWKDGKTLGAVMCMDNSVAILSRAGFASMKIENDTLTEPGRAVESEAGRRVFPPLTHVVESVPLPGPWICVDGEMGLVSAEGFSWKSAAGWNSLSVSYAELTPRATAGLWQMLASDAAGIAATAKVSAVDVYTTGIEGSIKDGPAGRQFRVRLVDDGFAFNEVNP